MWIGTPAATGWRHQITAGADITQIPTVQPGGVYVTRSLRDWAGLSDADRASVRFLLLQNGDDPIPKFEAPLLWRPPDWLGPDDTRPHGCPCQRILKIDPSGFWRILMIIATRGRFEAY